jgi:hypothetical protein
MNEVAQSPSLTNFAFSMHVIDEGSSGTWIPDAEVGIEEIVDRD